jgi:hypothetical protein
MLRTSFTLALAVVTTTAIARAQNVESLDAIPPAVTGVPAQPFAGAGQHRVPLTVPAWRGLEPALAITYASNAKAGWLGVGMTLEGVSTIERVSANLGAPTYGASDTYLLDGEPMIACVAGSPSPSCLTGGTHTTKRERYVRIVKAGTTWTVTSPTGVAEVYTTLAEPFAVLTSRTDRSGNAVTFSYAVVSGTTYPTSIAYNGTTISFAREARPEPLTLGTGAGLRQISQRLVAIAIRTDGALERAYRLSYGNAALPVGGGGWMGGSTAPGRSFLTAVQEYGSDATFNGAGAITGGTALPATSLTYNSDTPALSAGWSATLTPHRDHDHRHDRVRRRQRRRPRRRDRDPPLQHRWDHHHWQPQRPGRPRPGQRHLRDQRDQRDHDREPQHRLLDDDTRTGDVNGDGRTDVIWVRRKSTYACCGAAPVGYVDVQLALGTAAGSFTFPAVQRVSNVGDTSTYKEVVVGDFDGNGGADLAIVRLNHSNGVYTASNALIALSNGSGLGTATARTLNINDSGGPFGSAPSFAGARFHAGDVNGDGRDDLVLVRRASSICGTNLTTANAHLSAGNGTFAAPVYSLLTNACSHASFAGETLTDLNGDGLADLVGDSAFTIYGAGVQRLRLRCEDHRQPRQRQRQLRRGDHLGRLVGRRRRHRQLHGVLRRRQRRQARRPGRGQGRHEPVGAGQPWPRRRQLSRRVGGQRRHRQARRGSTAARWRWPTSTATVAWRRSRASATAPRGSS